MKQNNMDKSIKVAYTKAFDKNGVVYRQRVTIKLSKTELRAFNDHVLEHLMSGNASSYTKIYLKRLSAGDNYTNIHTFNHFIDFFELWHEKRIIPYYNTIVRVIII